MLQATPGVCPSAGDLVLWARPAILHFHPQRVMSEGIEAKSLRQHGGSTMSMSTMGRVRKGAKAALLRAPLSADHFVRLITTSSRRTCSIYVARHVVTVGRRLKRSLRQFNGNHLNRATVKGRLLQRQKWFEESFQSLSRNCRWRRYWTRPAATSNNNYCRGDNVQGLVDAKRLNIAYCK